MMNWTLGAMMAMALIFGGAAALLTGRLVPDLIGAHAEGPMHLTALQSAPLG